MDPVVSTPVGQAAKSIDVDKAEKEVSFWAGIIHTAAVFIKATATLLFAIAALGTAIYGIHGVGANTEKVDTSYVALRAEVLDLHERVASLEADRGKAVLSPVVAPTTPVVAPPTFVLAEPAKTLPNFLRFQSKTKVATPAKPTIYNRLPPALVDLVSKGVKEGVKQSVTMAVSPQIDD